MISVVRTLGALVLAVVPFAALALEPVDTPTSVLVRTVLAIAAFHGAGRVVAAASRRFAVDAFVAVQWGIGALVVLGGALMAAGLYTEGVQDAIVWSATAAHTAFVLGRALPAWTAIERRTRDAWVVLPAIVLVAVGAFAVLGAAGDTAARPFDDDGHVLSQIDRLRESGALGDPIGYARSAQLGGQLVLGALVSSGSDPATLRVLEPLAMVLALALVVGRLAWLGPRGIVWSILLVATTASFGLATTDPVATWTAVGLILALHGERRDAQDAIATSGSPDRPTGTPSAQGSRARSSTGLGRAAPPPAVSRSIPPTILCGVALILLRHELALVGVAAIATAALHAASSRARLTIALGSIAALAPLVVDVALADVPASLARPGVQLALLLGLAGVTLAACASLRRISGAPAGWLIIGGVLAVAWIVLDAVRQGPYALRFLWPLGIAGVLVAALELAPRTRASIASVALAMGLLATLHYGRVMGGRRSWTRRTLDVAANIEYLRHGIRPGPDRYAALLADVPDGAPVAVWVLEPERLDHRWHRLVDLRTPRGAAWASVPPGVRFAIIEGAPPPSLRDRGRVRHTEGDVRLVELAP